MRPSISISSENVKVTTVAPYLSPTGMSSTHTETLEMRYEAITGNTWTEIFTTATHGMTVVVHDSIILTQKCQYLVVGTILYINSKLKFILVGFCGRHAGKCQNLPP